MMVGAPHSRRGNLTRVKRIRRSWFVRLVVVLLLSWTAADLSDIRLCASDSNELGRLQECVVIESSHAQPASPSPFDDCFFCSHAVEAWTFSFTTALIAAVAVPEPTMPAPPLASPYSPYHPPKA